MGDDAATGEPSGWVWVALAVGLGVVAVGASVLLDGTVSIVVGMTAVLLFPFTLGFVARYRAVRGSGARLSTAVTAGAATGLRATLPPSPADIRESRSRSNPEL